MAIQQYANMMSGSIPAFGFIRQKQLLTFLPFSAATLWRKVDAGDFPKPYKLGPKITAWQVQDVTAWINSFQEVQTPNLAEK